MGLVYECGAGLVNTYYAKSNANIDAYIFSSGPSLKAINPADFNDKPIYKVGINTTYPFIKPDMWVGMDYPKCFNKNIWTEPCMKILRHPYSQHTINGKKVKDFPFVYFATIDSDITPNAAREIFQRRAHKTKFIWTNNTFTTTLHILVWMGFKRIHLIGSDFGGKENYFDDSEEYRPFNHDPDSPAGEISKKQEKKNRQLYMQQLAFLKSFCEQGQRVGLEVISCTKSSPANAFLRYVDPSLALKSSIEISQDF